MQVKYTWIVSDEVGYKTLYETFNGWYFVTNHVVGTLVQITEQHATDLKNNSKFGQ